MGAMSDTAESFLLVALCVGLWLVLWRRRNLRNAQQQQQPQVPRPQQVPSQILGPGINVDLPHMSKAQICPAVAPAEGDQPFGASEGRRHSKTIYLPVCLLLEFKQSHARACFLVQYLHALLCVSFHGLPLYCSGPWHLVTAVGKHCAQGVLRRADVRVGRLYPVDGDTGQRQGGGQVRQRSPSQHQTQPGSDSTQQSQQRSGEEQQLENEQ
jgi:hypothetical protein